MTPVTFFVIIVCALAFICILKWFHENWEAMCVETVTGSNAPPVYQAPKRPLVYTDHELIELCLYVGLDEFGITRREYDTVITESQRREVVEAGYNIVYG